MKLHSKVKPRILFQTVHIRLHSAHVAMLLSHSIHSSGTRLGWKHTWKPGPFGNDIHDHPAAKQLGVKVEIGLIFT